MPSDKVQNSRYGLHERLCKIRIGRVTDDDEQCNPMSFNRFQFIGLVADAAIVRESDPSPLSDRMKPFFVGTIVSKMIAV